MKFRIRLLLSVAALTLGSWHLVQGQAPAPPPVPAAIPAAPAAAPKNIWSFFCLTEEQHEKCRKHFCNSFIGKSLGAILVPINAYAGGNITGCCPRPDQARPEDLAKPADSAGGAAARIKKDEEDAKARRADVRYLGTVNCRRYPEAEKALINALRSDANECVRWEAALALSSGCCCTKNTVEALRLTAVASDKDGNPPETSMRVRNAAIMALSVCEIRVPPQTPEPPELPPVFPPDPKKAPESPGPLTLGTIFQAPVPAQLVTLPPAAPMLPPILPAPPPTAAPVLPPLLPAPPPTAAPVLPPVLPAPPPTLSTSFTGVLPARTEPVTSLPPPSKTKVSRGLFDLMSRPLQR